MSPEAHRAPNHLVGLQFRAEIYGFGRSILHAEKPYGEHYLSMNSAKNHLWGPEMVQGGAKNRNPTSHTKLVVGPLPMVALQILATYLEYHATPGPLGTFFELRTF